MRRRQGLATVGGALAAVLQTSPGILPGAVPGCRYQTGNGYNAGVPKSGVNCTSMDLNATTDWYRQRFSDKPSLVIKVRRQAVRQSPKSPAGPMPHHSHRCLSLALRYDGADGPGAPRGAPHLPDR